MSKVPWTQEDRASGEGNVPSDTHSSHYNTHVLYLYGDFMACKL